MSRLKQICQSSKRGKNGFTLIEVIIVVAIGLILVGAIAPLFKEAKKEAIAERESRGIYVSAKGTPNDPI